MYIQQKRIITYIKLSNFNEREKKKESNIFVFMLSLSF